MSEKVTGTIQWAKRGKDSDDGKWASFLDPDSGKYARIYKGHAHLITVGEPCDVECSISDKGYVFINKVNGTNTSKPAQQIGGGGGLLGGGKAKGSPLGSKAPVADGKTYEGAWAGMGPENRAAQACLHYLEAKAGIKEWDHGGMDALAIELNIVKRAWLRGVEGKGMPPAAGNSQAGGGDDLNDEIPFDQGDPGPQGMDDYGQ